jgi:hypothetical protein
MQARFELAVERLHLAFEPGQQGLGRLLAAQGLLHAGLQAGDVRWAGQEKRQQQERDDEDRAAKEKLE